MPSRYIVCAHGKRFFQKCAKFHFFIAHHIRIWRTSGFVFRNHVIRHFFFVDIFKVKSQKWNI